MKYGEVREALFLRRKNRFVADVMLPEAGEVAVHVKNTGRLRELLLPGARVILAKADNPARKTPYDLIGVYRKEKDGTERLLTKSPERYLMEVKGCTLDRDGIGYFPDAPTERGVKHLHELAKASAAGYHAFLAFVIQMEGVLEVRPNTETHPEFAEALQAAEQAGVQVLHLRTIVRPDSLEVRAEGPGVRLDG